MTCPNNLETEVQKNSGKAYGNTATFWLTMNHKLKLSFH